MRFWGITAGGGARTARRAAVAAMAAMVAGGWAAAEARAASPTVAPYGQVAAVGGLESGPGVDYAPTSTSGLTNGSFVDPVGMAIAPDSSSPGGEDIYVLDLVNPQAMNGLNAGTASEDDVAFEYRLQEIAITPSNATGSDAGSETVLACTAFTLQSTSSAPDQRAVSLAVNAPSNQVDVLVNAMPDFQGFSSGYSIAYQVDQWGTSLGGGASGTCPVTASPDIAVPSTTLVKKNQPGLRGDIDGDSVTFAGTGAGAKLALGGSEYLSSPASTGTSKTEPIIELFSGQTVSGTWTKSEDAANALAKSAPIAGKNSAGGWGIDQNSKATNGGNGDVLYALSANPDGSLSVTLGPQEYGESGQYTAFAGADFEPIMATVSADLSTTTPVLPSAQASPTYNYPAGWTVADDDPPVGDVNSEIAATDAAEQDTADNSGITGSFAPGGGTQDGGTLAPSVVALAGTESGLYAGYVADDLGGTDSNLDQASNPVAEPAWTVPNTTLGGTTANLGVRVFTGCGTDVGCASGTPLALIGNAGIGACSIRSGAYGFTQNGLPSTIALAAGPDGTIYALTQPDLDALGDATISPADPVSGTGVGDVLMEFKPGAGSGSSPGVQCPQPTTSFSVTDQSDPSAAPDLGTGAVQVLQGATIQLDASTSQLQGGVPWTYTWDSDVGGSDDQTPQPATFTPDGDDANTVYDRANPTQDFIYTTPGQSTAQLQLQSDYGTTTVTRPIDVVAPGPITAAVAASGGAVAGQPTTLSAAGTSVAAPDSIVDYHWDFGNGTSDDTSGPNETWTFPSSGTYTVTLTAIDQIGRIQTATVQVSVAPPPPAPPAPAATTSTPAPAPQTAHRFSVSPKLRGVKSNADLSAKLSCPAGDRTCAGTIAILTAGKVTVPGRKGKHILSLGKGTFTVTAGHSRTLLLKLAGVTQKLISPQQPLKLTVLVVAHDSAGAHATQRVPVYLFPPAGSRPRKFG